MDDNILGQQNALCKSTQTLCGGISMFPQLKDHLFWIKDRLNSSTIGQTLNLKGSCENKDQEAC